MTQFHRHYAQPRDPAALRQLHEQYSAYKNQGCGTHAHPWTPSQVLTLGRLYTQAWGIRPTPTRMRAQWGLPTDATTIRLFGSYSAYYAALQEAPHATP